MFIIHRKISKNHNQNNRISQNLLPQPIKYHSKITHKIQNLRHRIINSEKESSKNKNRYHIKESKPKKQK